MTNLQAPAQISSFQAKRLAELPVHHRLFFACPDLVGGDRAPEKITVAVVLEDDSVGKGFGVCRTTFLKRVKPRCGFHGGAQFRSRGLFLPDKNMSQLVEKQMVHEDGIEPPTDRV